MTLEELLTEFSPEERLSLLIHARSKYGKSTLSSTAPQPILVLDAEGSWRFIPARKVYWDPLTGPPPTWDGTWDVCIVIVNQWSVVETAYNWMTQTQTPFVTVVLDSITEIQRRCRANLKGIAAMQIQDWGVLLSVMDSVIRGFRDLTLRNDSYVRCVVFVAETRESNVDGRLVPYMQGQISVSLPYWVDVCGYLFVDYEKDENGQASKEVRRLQIGPHAKIECGERVGWGEPYITMRAPIRGQVGTDLTDWMRELYRK